MWLLDELEKRKQSEDVAIRYMDEYITYKDMWYRSECIAQYLHSQGLNRKPLVIYGHKEIDIIPCMHAALKVGIPYVPVDTLYPIERLNQIAHAVDADVIVNFSQKNEVEYNVINKDVLKNIYRTKVPGGKQRILGRHQ